MARTKQQAFKLAKKQAKDEGLSLTHRQWRQTQLSFPKAPNNKPAAPENTREIIDLTKPEPQLKPEDAHAIENEGLVEARRLARSASAKENHVGQRENSTFKKDPGIEPHATRVKKESVLESAENLVRKRNGDADVEEGEVRIDESRAKRVKTKPADSSKMETPLEHVDTLRIYDGKEEQDWPEVRTGEIPPYPVRRPYHLGGMGRYGIDIPVEGHTPASRHGFTPINAVLERATPAPAIAPYSRVAFRPDEFVPMARGEQPRPADADNIHSSYSPGSPRLRDQRFDRASTSSYDAYADAVSFEERWARHREERPARHREEYVFDWGAYRGARIDAVPHSYLKTLGGQPHILDSHRGLLAAFEQNFPQYLKGGIQQPSAQRHTSRHPRDYVFDFGKFEGTRFDQAPQYYLSMLEGQVRAGVMDRRRGLKEAFEWYKRHGGGMREVREARERWR